MITRLSNTNCRAFAVALLLIILLPYKSAAVSFSNDTIPHQKSLYLKRIDKYESFWSKIIPKYTKLQMAGGMGIVSTGFGWNYGTKKQWETDVMIGVIPKYHTKHVKGTLTLKQNYIPWSIPIYNRYFSFEPLRCGLYLNTILSDDYWVDEPDRYPNNYYGFSTRIRPYIFLGQSFTYNVKDNKFKRHQSISLYYELSSCDVYIISAVKNSSIKLNDIVKLSVGLKFQIL